MDGNCGACRKVVKSTEQGLCCDLCQMWFHVKCSNASKALVEFLNSDDGQQANVHWYCCCCEKGSRKLFEQMVVIDKRISSLETQLSDLNEKVDSIIKHQQSSTEAGVRPRSDPTQSQQPQNLAHIVRESEDSNRRKCNVVIYGVKEGEETVVEELIKAIDSQIEMVSSPTRLGSGEKRPLLVKFKTEQEK